MACDEALKRSYEATWLESSLAAVELRGTGGCILLGKYADTQKSGPLSDLKACVLYNSSEHSGWLGNHVFVYITFSLTGVCHAGQIMPSIRGANWLVAFLWACMIATDATAGDSTSTSTAQGAAQQPNIPPEGGVVDIGLCGSQTAPKRWGHQPCQPHRQIKTRNWGHNNCMPFAA